MRRLSESRTENISDTLGKPEWLLARSEQANNNYSRAQMEAFTILRDSFRERMDTMPSGIRVDMETGTCNI